MVKKPVISAAEAAAKATAAVGPVEQVTHRAVAAVMLLLVTAARANRFGNSAWPN